MPDSVQAPPTRKPRPRRRRLWVVLGCLLILGTGFGRFAYRRITLRPTPRPEYWEAKLAALDPPPPGAVPESQALALFTTPIWETDPAITSLTNFHPRQILWGVWKTARADTAAVSRAFASRLSDQARREMLRVLEAGWPEPLSMDPEAFLNRPMYHPQATFWLLAHSRWAREETADPAVAAEDWLAALRMARQVRRQQTSTPQLVEGTLICIVAEEIMLAAREGVAPRNTRELAERIDRIVGRPRTPRELLEGERLAARCELEYIFVREGGQWMDVAEMVRHKGTGAWAGNVLMPMPAASPSRLWNLTAPVFHSLSEAVQGLDRYQAEFDRCVDLIACRRMDEWLATNPCVGIDALDGYPGDIALSPASPGSVRVIANHYEAMCSLDAAVTMLALAAYHERHDEYPATLAELIPKYLPRLPVDYADRNPLRYRREKGNYVLYSIGTDGRDDGGIDRTGGHPTLLNDDGDVVFSTIRRNEEER